MAETLLNVANQSLQMMGSRSSIAVLTENSAEARNVNIALPPTIVEVLASVNWNFARRSVKATVVQSTAAGASILPPWSYAVSYPTDAIKVRWLDIAAPVQTAPIFGLAVDQQLFRPGGPRIPYRVAGATINAIDTKVILTTIANPIITYTKLINDLSLWEPLALALLKTCLAQKLIGPLSGDKGTYDRLDVKVKELRAAAAVEDANEDISTVDVAPDWIVAREYGTDYPFYLGDGNSSVVGGGTDPGGGGSVGGITVVVDGGVRG